MDLQYDMERMERRARGRPIVKEAAKRKVTAERFAALMKSYQEVRAYDPGISIGDFIDDFIESYLAEKASNPGVVKERYLAEYTRKITRLDDDAELDLDEALEAFKKYRDCE